MARPAPRSREDTEQLAFSFGERRPIQYRLRLRTMEISIDAGGMVAVAAPTTTPQGEIDAFIQHKTSWIERRLEEQRNGGARSRMAPDRRPCARRRRR